MKLDANTVDEYFEAVPEARKNYMSKLREIIKSSAPGVEEVFRHKLPFYDLNGTYFMALASQKHHIGVYLNQPDLLEKYADALGKVSKGKSCIRLKDLDNVDLEVFRTMIEEAFNTAQ